MTYLFWTGGFDSTFRLIQLVRMGRPVTAIYLTGNVDGCAGRKNQTKELASMANILKEIHINWQADIMFQRINVNNISLDADIKDIGLKAFQAGYFSRPVNQYANMAQVARNLGIVGEVCIVNDGVMKSSYGLIKRYNNPYTTLSFPLINTTKQEIMEIAKRNKFDNIMKMTWSCWYPVNGRPCGKCDMCAGRII